MIMRALNPITKNQPSVHVIPEPCLAPTQPPLSPSHTKTQILSMAKLFGHLRRAQGVWQTLVYELLEVEGVDIDAIAGELRVSPRTIKRILAFTTRRPNIKTSFKLFKLHAQWRTDRYEAMLAKALYPR
jgi:hypothetical protein